MIIITIIIVVLVVFIHPKFSRCFFFLHLESVAKIAVPWLLFMLEHIFRQLNRIVLDYTHHI